MGFSVKDEDLFKFCKWAGFIGLLLITACGVFNRAERLNYPPLDYPSDRQKSYCAKIDAFNDGVALMDVQGKWLELRLLPWMVSKTGFVGKMFGWEVWTQARVYSLIASGLMIFMLGLCGYLSGGVTGFSVPRRVLLGLVCAGMLAFNPFHRYLSRLIMTEPITLMFQASTLLFLLMSMRRPKKWYLWLGCVLMLVMAGLAKIPSFIWCPAIFFAFVMNSHVDKRLRIGGAVAGAVMILSVFAFYRLNPLVIFDEFSSYYAKLESITGEMTQSPIWDRAYLGRTVMMLGLPVALLALLGMCVAPWIYRITAILFLLMFYRLVHLNTYNFAHIILPGTMLAAHGLDWLLNAPVRRERVWRWHWIRLGMGPVDWSVRAAFLLVLLLGLAPHGPRFDYDERLRLGAIQALKIAKEESLTAQNSVSYDDETAVVGYYVNRIMGKGVFGEICPTPDDARTTFFYSNRSRGTSIISFAADNWVTRANIYNEPFGVLYDRRRNLKFSPPNDGSYLMAANPQYRRTPASGLRIVRIGVEASRIDTTNHTFKFKPGETFDLYIDWENGDPKVTLAMITLRSSEWSQLISLPIEKGGIQIISGAVACLSDPKRGISYYRVKIPETFPPGDYFMYYDGITPEEWETLTPDFKSLPMKFVCVPSDLDSGTPTISMPFKDVYPVKYNAARLYWNEEKAFEDFEMNGVEISVDSEYIVGLPIMPAGKYRATVRGKGTWITGGAEGKVHWPTVSLYLSQNKDKPVGKIFVNSEKPGDYSVEFTAKHPFTTIMLDAHVQKPSDGVFPSWIVDPIAYSYSDFPTQRLRLRNFKIEKIEEPES